MSTGSADEEYRRPSRPRASADRIDMTAIIIASEAPGGSLSQPRPADRTSSTGSRCGRRMALTASAQKRNCRVSFTTNARFWSIGKPRLSQVSRWSLYTTNSSLPG